MPADGLIEGGIHRFPLRVYFEDTDLSGIVYHANYLRYMERARSDLLARLGIDQRAMIEAGEGVYAVADLAIRYVTPARLGDALIVETRCLDVGGASVRMGQRLRRGDMLVAEAMVRAGFLTPDGRPRRQPRPWVEQFRQLLAITPKD